MSEDDGKDVEDKDKGDQVSFILDIVPFILSTLFSSAIAHHYRRFPLLPHHPVYSSVS